MGFYTHSPGKIRKNNFLFFCIGFPMVGGVGLHRETGAAPRLYRVRSIKSIGLGPKSMISRKPFRFNGRGRGRWLLFFSLAACCMLSSFFFSFFFFVVFLLHLVFFAGGQWKKLWKTAWNQKKRSWATCVACVFFFDFLVGADGPPQLDSDIFFWNFF